MPSPLSRPGIVSIASGVGALIVAALVATTTPPDGGAPPRPVAGTAKEAAFKAPARNVILLIGDGMGDSEITMARYYRVGAAGRLAMDKLPMTGAYTTYSVMKGRPGRPDYAPDSAATGSAWATGRKTYDGAISVRPNGKPAPTIAELARRAGYRTGNVTTAELTDATPAVLGAHVVDRSCKGPNNMAQCPRNAKQNGGAGSIAEQLTQTRFDVLLGGGASSWSQKVKAGRFKGKTVRQQARASGYRVLTTKRQLARAKGTKRTLGLFAPASLEVAWKGPKPTHGGTSPARCTRNARPASQPQLVGMTSKALSILTQKTRNSRKGFFLQVEGASIDKQDHAADPCGQIGETVAFDAAVRRVLAYQKQHPNTLVVVTADHGHTAQIVGAGVKTPGVTATLITADGAPMTINYATSEPPTAQRHTGTQVRIAAKGPLSRRVLGVTDQTDLFVTMRKALGVR